MVGAGISIDPGLVPHLAIGGSCLFVLIVVWLHYGRRDLHPGTHGLSRYAAGSSRLAMTAAFLALAASTACLAIEIGIASHFAGNELRGLALLWVAAIGIAVVAAVPVPDDGGRSWRRPVHTGGALLFFLCAAGGALMVRTGQTAASGTIAWLLATAVVLFLASMARVPRLFEVRGWLQRACFALFVLWLVLVGQRLVGEAIRRAAM
jgi:uncharacterized protein DUF998